MSERRLKTFQTVVRTGSFSRAADELAMTQPAVSVQVRQLEESLKARLLERSRTRLRLTPEGELVLQYADRILALHEEMKRKIKEITPKLPG